MRRSSWGVYPSACTLFQFLTKEMERVLACSGGDLSFLSFSILYGNDLWF